MKNIYELTVSEVHEKVLKQEISAVDVVEATINRIEETENKVESFLSLRKEKAMAEALELDKKIAAGEKVGELAGVVISIKDNILIDGEVSTAASKMLEDYTSVYDATVIQKLKKADAIIIGKTNMDEFAMGGTTTSSAFKKTKNPWDQTKVAGGSSGGSVTSVAAGQSFISLGTDTGGSVRQPSAYCGTVGLKPTYGRVSRYGVMSLGSSFDQVGPIGKCVKDIAMTLNIIAGPSEVTEYDSTLEDVKVDDYTKHLTGDIKGLKIGIPKEYMLDALKPEAKKLMADAIEKYREAGAEIVDISLPHTKYAISTYYLILCAEVSSNLSRYDGVRYGHRSENSSNVEDMYINSRTEGLGNEVKRRIMLGTYVLNSENRDAYYTNAQKVRRLIKEDFINAFKDVDAIFTPTTPTEAFNIDAKKTPLEVYMEDAFTTTANLAGVPAISFPIGEINDMPFGGQLIGKAFDEKTILRIAEAFERKNDIKLRKL